VATNDVPGANPVNNDELHVGCWAEHEDGSLIFIEGVEDPNSVIYSVFDMTQDPPLEFRDAMPKDGFEEQFSWNDDDDSIKWTWHDKTEFPWSRVMGDFPPGTRSSSAMATLSAAQRVAHRLNLQGKKVSKTRGRGRQLATDIMRNLRNKIRGLGK